MIIPWFANKIMFPTNGTEELEHQLYYFGAERYDDMVDALTLIPLAMPEIEKHFSTGVVMINNPFQDYVKQLLGNKGRYDDDYHSDEHKPVNDWRSWRRLIG